jgi:hypothetical protein
MLKISIAKEFTRVPGGRYRPSGPDSAELFYTSLLRPRFVEAKEQGVKLLVDLDGTQGYPASFLEESFGRLENDYPGAHKQLIFRSIEEPYLVDDIKLYMTEKYV